MVTTIAWLPRAGGPCCQRMAKRAPARGCTGLGPIALVMFVLFAIDTILVVNGFWLPIDVKITAFIQGVNWGPVVYPMQVINMTAGYWQVLVGVVAIVALFIVDRRAGWLMLIGSISNLLDNIVKLLVSRPRPTVDLVHGL